MELTIARHCVARHPGDALSPLQRGLLEEPRRVRIASAPTGAGKSYAFQYAMRRGERVLFIVPTRRLAQNLVAGLRDSLVHDEGWPEVQAREKVVPWTSDETQRLRAAGVTNIGPHRIRQLTALDPTRGGGEMIVAVPEVVSRLLLRPRWEMKPGQAAEGIFDLLTQFHHLVFDEFHTIAPRGFGLAAVCAKLAAELPGTRARVSLLSATPLDIAPVLERFEVSEDQIAVLREEITPEGRALHGDVRLVWREDASLAEVLEAHIAEIAWERQQGRQTVILYNALRDLREQEPVLEGIVRRAGISPERVLCINSQDDSRAESNLTDRFVVGRHQKPENFEVLIATASLELGVTFRANLLLTEPGFEPLNFLQRYGRAARGDHTGTVVVRADAALMKNRPWLRRLRRWIEEHRGQTMGIEDLTRVLSQEAMQRFEPCPEDKVYFGRLPNRAAYAAGLYWKVLCDHPTNQGHRRAHLIAHQPAPAKMIYALLKKVRVLEQDRQFGKIAKDWCERFELEAEALRDIGDKIRVVENGGEAFWTEELWLRRHTDILDRFPLTLGEDGVEEVRIPGRLRQYIPEERQYVPAMRTVFFPHTGQTTSLKDDSELVENWCRAFRSQNSFAWKLHAEALEAAERLVRLTGLVVSDDEHPGLGAQSGVL
jgi:superfamily II DNA/RNA helicase